MYGKELFELGDVPPDLLDCFDEVEVQCGKPWKRVMARTSEVDTSAKGSRFDKGKTADNGLGRVQEGERFLSRTLGWRPTCSCYDDRYRSEFPQASNARQRWQRQRSGDWWRRVRKRPGKDAWSVMPCTVLDSFAGSGTTGEVAVSLGRKAILIDLNPEYRPMQIERIGKAHIPLL